MKSLQVEIFGGAFVVRKDSGINSIHDLRR